MLQKVTVHCPAPSGCRVCRAGRQLFRASTSVQDMWEGARQAYAIKSHTQLIYILNRMRAFVNALAATHCRGPAVGDTTFALPIISSNAIGNDTELTTDNVSQRYNKEFMGCCWVACDNARRCERSMLKYFKLQALSNVYRRSCDMPVLCMGNALTWTTQITRAKLTSVRDDREARATGCVRA